MDLKELARNKGTNLKRVAEKSGIPASTLYAIACGDTNFDNVGISRFMKLSEELGMSAEELYYDMPNEEESNLSAEETELLDCYRSADLRGKAAIMDVARRERSFSEDTLDGRAVTSA